MNKPYSPRKSGLVSFVALMQKRGMLIAFLVSCCLTVLGQNLPEVSKTIVTDYTHTLSGGQLQQLENKLVTFNDTTSTQIAVVLVNSTEGYDVADYAVRLANKWGVGDKKYNNGVMLLAAIGDRAVTIQTGYGVEGALPDAIAYRIIENDIKPAFRAGDYYGGLDAATNSIIAYTKGEYKADVKDTARREGDGGGGGFGTIVIIVIILIIVSLISKGGGRNGGRRVIDGRGGSDLFWWMLLNGLGGSSRDNDRDGGFGGGFGGGSGGGFGGFGGGSFGGGGASGRW